MSGVIGSDISWSFWGTSVGYAKADDPMVYYAVSNGYVPVKGFWGGEMNVEHVRFARISIDGAFTVEYSRGLTRVPHPDDVVKLLAGIVVPIALFVLVQAFLNWRRAALIGRRA
jgi:hypothetical protein